MLLAADGFKPGFIHIRAFGPLVARPGWRGVYAFFFTSLMLENTMPSARSRV